MHKDFFEKIADINQSIIRTSLPLYLRNTQDIHDVNDSHDSHESYDSEKNYNNDDSNITHDFYASCENKVQASLYNKDVLSYALDKQAQAFLSKYYDRPILSASALEVHLSMWNYESLLHTIDHAKEHSLAYKKRLSAIPCQKLLQEAHEKFANFAIVNSSLANPKLTNHNPTNPKLTNHNPINPKRANPKLADPSLANYTLNYSANIQEIRLLCKNLLEHVPCTTDQDIAHNPDAFLAVSHDDVYGVISVETSGTTARSQNVWNSTNNTLHSPIMPSKRVYCSASDLQSTIDFFFYGMQYMLRAKGNKGNRVALLMSGLRQGSVGHLLKKAMDTLGIDCMIFGFPTHTGKIPEKMIEDLLKYEPTCLIGVPGHIFSLSHYAQNTKLKDTLDCVLLSGDSLTKNMRQQIAKNLSCDVFVHYGLTETGLGGAVECKQHAGLHIRQLDLYIEILDENLQPLPDGEMGEIVITTLTRQAMPLMRYRTGDMGRLIQGMCDCGSILQRLEVQGRIQQSISLRGNNAVHITAFQDFFYAYSEIIDFELCVLTDDTGNYTYSCPCLLVGIEFASHNIAHHLDILQKKFEKTFNISNILKENLEKPELERLDLKENGLKGKRLNENENTGIMNFYMCTMDTYKNFIAQNTHAQSTHEVTSELFPLKHVTSAFSSKKYIRYLQGSLFHLYTLDT